MPHKSTTDMQHQNFVASNAASARTIASDATINLDAANTATQLGLQAPKRNITECRGALARGYSDSIALVAAHHNAKLHSSLQPKGIVPLQIFNDMERARCEALGAEKLTGSANNMAILWQRQNSENLLCIRSDDERLLIAIAALTREVLHAGQPGYRSTIASSPKTAEIANHHLQTHNALWMQLAATIKNQHRYAELSLKIIAATDCGTNQAPLPDSDATNQDQPDQNTDEETESTEDEDNADDTLTVTLREDDQNSSGDLKTSDPQDNTEPDASANRDSPVSTESDGASSGTVSAAHGYCVYSKANDEIVSARDLCNPEDSITLRELLDQQIHRHARVIGKLSGRLQRVLMTQQARHWQFNLPEGTLDTSRLTRVVTQPMAPLAFKQEADSDFKDTSITLLVDNSKSMLGKPIAIAAACTDILSQTLERCGVSVEILGFTTTELHRGAMYEQWQQSGSSQHPGRLNSLRHIIYKSADTPYRRARMNFGVMLMKDLLKQNIDGESLLWAHSRLIKRPEKRKVLIVISDGAPIDTSTMAVNKENYLVDHLHQVIKSIESDTRVELLAIGIGHDVTKYYQRSMKIMDVKDLSQSLLSHMSELFTH